MAARAAKRKEEHRIWMELMGFSKKEDIDESKKDNTEKTQ